MLMILVTVALWFATYVALVKKFKEKINPIIFIFHYFYGALFFSQLSLTGIPAPSEGAVLLFILSYLSALVGVLLSKNKKNIFKSDGLYKNIRYIYCLGLFVGVLPLSLIILKNFNGLLDYASYVQKVRFEGDSIAVAGSAFITSLIDRVTKPVAVFIAVTGISIYITKERSRLFYIGCYILVCLSILYVKRIEFVIIFILLFAGKVAVNSKTDGSSKNVYIIMTIFVFFIFGVSSFRASSLNLYGVFLHYGIGYHTFGFALFDHALRNPASHIHDFVFPGSTIFATFDFIINQISKVLSVDHIPISSYLYSEELGYPVHMGYNSFNGGEISPNAFYTSLYPIYRDMRWFGIVVFSFIYGYVFSNRYLSFKLNNDVTSLAWVLFFVYVGYTSLLTPIIMGNSFWFIPLLILFFSRFVLHKS